MIMYNSNYFTKQRKINYLFFVCVLCRYFYSRCVVKHKYDLSEESLKKVKETGKKVWSYNIYRDVNALHINVMKLIKHEK